MIRPGSDLTDEQDRASLSGKIANFKIPEVITIVSDPLPRNATGKILNRQLRETAT